MLPSSATIPRPFAGPISHAARFTTPPSVIKRAMGPTSHAIPAASKKYWIACITPEARLSWDAGITIAIASVARTVQITIMIAESAIARGKSRCGFLVSSAWKPAISIPAKRRTIVAKNGSVERLMVGTVCASVKCGITIFCPEPSHQRPSPMMRREGMMLPRITPTFENFVEASSPK